MSNGIIDETIPDFGEGWREITPTEALSKIEQFLTRDLVAFEIEHSADPTPIGDLESFTWFKTLEDDDQSPVLLALRDPVLQKVRWFIFSDLVTD